MSSPRLEPWLMPETTMSASKPSTRPSMARRTQSTGVPSVAKPLVPSSNGHLLHPQRAARGDHAGERGAVAVGGDDRQLDSRQLHERPAQGLQALGLDAVVVGEQDLHLGHPILSRSLDSTLEPLCKACLTVRNDVRLLRTRARPLAGSARRRPRRLTPDDQRDRDRALPAVAAAGLRPRSLLRDDGRADLPSRHRGDPDMKAFWMSATGQLGLGLVLVAARRSPPSPRAATPATGS